MAAPADLNARFQLMRKAVFAALGLFSVVVIILSAIIINHTTSWGLGLGFYYPFSALGIAVGILTLFSLPVMLFLSIKRQGAVTSMVAVEVAWTWFLWILWLSLGGNAATYNWGGCSTSYYGSYLTGYYSSVYNTYSGSCREAQALTAFAFLGWILLFSYNMALITFVVRLHLRGHTNVWTSYVTETNFEAAPAGPGAGVTSDKFAPQYPASSVSSPGSYPAPSPGVPYPGAQYPQPGAQYPQPGVQHPQAGAQYPQV